MLEEVSRTGVLCRRDGWRGEVYLPQCLLEEAPVFALRGGDFWTAVEECGGEGSPVQPLFPCRHPVLCRLYFGGRLDAPTGSELTLALLTSP